MSDTEIITPESMLAEYIADSRIDSLYVPQYRCRGCVNDRYCRDHGTTRAYLKWVNWYDIHSEDIKSPPRSFEEARQLVTRTHKYRHCRIAVPNRVYKLVARGHETTSTDKLWEVRIVRANHPEAISARITGYHKGMT